MFEALTIFQQFGFVRDTLLAWKIYPIEFENILTITNTTINIYYF